jgi:hypothetical protein
VLDAPQLLPRSQGRRRSSTTSGADGSSSSSSSSQLSPLRRRLLGEGGSLRSSPAASVSVVPCYSVKRSTFTALPAARPRPQQQHGGGQQGGGQQQAKSESYCFDELSLHLSPVMGEVAAAPSQARQGRRATMPAGLPATAAGSSSSGGGSGRASPAAVKGPQLRGRAHATGGAGSAAPLVLVHAGGDVGRMYRRYLQRQQPDVLNVSYALESIPQLEVSGPGRCCSAQWRHTKHVQSLPVCQPAGWCPRMHAAGAHACMQRVATHACMHAAARLPLLGSTS